MLPGFSNRKHQRAVRRPVVHQEPFGREHLRVGAVLVDRRQAFARAIQDLPGSRPTCITLCSCCDVVTKPNGSRAATHPSLLESSEGHVRNPVAIGRDARVTISPIHTSGVSTSWTRTGKSVIFNGPSWEQQWANADLRAIADLTGGQTSIYKYASRAFARIERATRFHYVLGYYPANATWDGDERRIKVTVRRTAALSVHVRETGIQRDAVACVRQELAPIVRHEIFRRVVRVPVENGHAATAQQVGDPAGAGLLGYPIRDSEITTAARQRHARLRLCPPSPVQ